MDQVWFVALCKLPVPWVVRIQFLDVWAATKCLKIPKGYSESVNRRTDNTMAKRQTTQWPKEKKTKVQTTIYKTLHIKQKID